MVSQFLRKLLRKPSRRLLLAYHPSKCLNWCGKWKWVHRLVCGCSIRDVWGYFGVHLVDSIRWRPIQMSLDSCCYTIHNLLTPSYKHWLLWEWLTLRLLWRYYIKHHEELPCLPLHFRSHQGRVRSYILRSHVEDLPLMYTGDLPLINTEHLPQSNTGDRWLNSTEGLP